jgi:hypothetical protein
MGCLSVLVLLATGAPTYGLYMVKAGEGVQTTNANPFPRTVSLKLPLRQTDFHWTFMSRKALLAGKLVLRIVRTGETNDIVVFDGGQMTDGWEAMPFPNPKAGEIYFGFKSSKKYATAPKDRLELELQVKQDLSGIGPEQKGVLPAGTYKARGTYSMLLDEYKLSDQLKEAPKETISKLRKAFDFTAFLESWGEQWDLRITSKEGWLPAGQAEAYKQMSEKMPKDGDAAKK